MRFRILMEGIIFSIIVILGILGYQVMMGVIRTANYVPDIIHSYESVDYLQSKVAFGVVLENGWVWSVFLWFAIPCTIYIVLRVAVLKFLNKRGD